MPLTSRILIFFWLFIAIATAGPEALIALAKEPPERNQEKPHTLCDEELMELREGVINLSNHGFSNKEIRSWAIAAVSSRISPFVDLDGVMGESAWHWKWMSQDYNEKDKTLTIHAHNQKTQEKKTVKIPWNQAWQKQVDHFAAFPMGELGLKIPSIDVYFEAALKKKGIKAGERFFLKASEKAGKADLASHALQESLLFEVLLRKEEILKSSDPAFPQYLVFEARATKLLIQEILGGGPKSIVPFVAGHFPLSWRKLLKWDLASQNTQGDSIEQIHYRGIEGLLFTRESDQPIKEHLAFELFLAHLYFKLKNEYFSTRESGRQSPFAYSLSLIEADGKPTQAQFQFVDGHALKQRQDDGQQIPPQFESLPEQVRKFIEGRYSKELNLTHEQLKELITISRDMQNRTRYLALTQESYVKLSPEIKEALHPVMQFMLRFRELGARDFDFFTVLGAMSIVESKNASEPVPLEVFTEVRIERLTNKPIVEIGRFSVLPGLRPMGPKQIWQVCTVIAATQDLEKIVAETTEAYALELIEKYGFKKVSERKNFEGKTEYIIEATTEALFAKSFLND